jgi:outer membrane protein assembly factor BamB
MLPRSCTPRRARRFGGAAALGLLLTSLPTLADDWPQWLGPKRDAVWRETGILDKLPSDGPKVLWRKPIQGGYSGPAVAGGKLYVMDRVHDKSPPKAGAVRGRLAGTERVLCLDARTGDQIWKHEYDCPYERISYPEGPRTTPVVEGDRVYTLGTMGDMKCLDAKTGQVIWAKNFPKDSGVKPPDPDVEQRKDAPVQYNIRPPVWGYSAHLLLDGDRLITLVGGDGGAVRAFDKKTGKELWKALTDRDVCYSPPVIAEAGGTRQLIVWTSQWLSGLNPDTGAVYWKLKFPHLPEGKKSLTPAGQPPTNIVTPRVAGDLLYVSTVFDGLTCVRLAKDKPTAAVAWASGTSPKGGDKLPVLMSTILIKGGHLYGIHNSFDEKDGTIVCLEAETGKEVWTDAGLFPGQEKAPFKTVFWVENGDKLVATTDFGDLVLLKLSPKGYEELGRAHIIEPTLATRGRKAVWAHPAFADKCLYTRNDKEIICVSLAKE